MLDPLLRRLIDPPRNRAGAWLAARSVPANGATLAGLAIGILTVPVLAYGLYDAALLVIVINTLIDGLNGATLEGIALSVSTEGRIETIIAEWVLISTDRRPNTEGFRFCG